MSIIYILKKNVNPFWNRFQMVHAAVIFPIKKAHSTQPGRISSTWLFDIAILLFLKIFCIQLI